MKSVFLLLSGGIDSAACIHFYKNKGYSVKGLFIDFGQASARQEEKAATAIAKYYNINLKIIRVIESENYSSGYIKGRNAFFLFTALMNYPFDSGIIATAIHEGTPYYDCTEEFLNILQNLFYKYTNGIVEIGAPFINLTKLDIFKYCHNNKVPIELTYSCELGFNQPCGKCKSCKDIERLNAY